MVEMKKLLSLYLKYSKEPNFSSTTTQTFKLSLPTSETTFRSSNGAHDRVRDFFKAVFLSAQLLSISLEVYKGHKKSKVAWSQIELKTS